MDTDGEVPITVSADGSTFALSGPVMLATADRAQTWFAPKGVPPHARAVSDKADPKTWYAVDYLGGRMFVSHDGARSFSQVAAKGLPADLSGVRPRSRETPPFIIARPGVPGELWFLAGAGRIYRSTDFGQSFTARTSTEIIFAMFGLGKAAPESPYPALYAFGVKPTMGGLWRSTDGGSSWLRINDDAHQWGMRYRAITGDPRIFGRVYFATDGRGIIYGDPKVGIR